MNEQKNHFKKNKNNKCVWINMFGTGFKIGINKKVSIHLNRYYV